MKNLISLLFSSILLLASPSFAKEKKAEEKPKIKTTKEEQFGNWVYRCFESPNKKETCGVFYDVVAENKDTKHKFHALSLRIYKDPVAKKKVISFITPISMNLPTGIDFKIDGKTHKKLPFLTCVPQPLSCSAILELDKTLHQKLTKSKKMTIIYKPLMAKKPFDIDLKTDGYIKAMKKL